jgi:hypothetical protein
MKTGQCCVEHSLRCLDEWILKEHNRFIPELMCFAVFFTSARRVIPKQRPGRSEGLIHTMIREWRVAADVILPETEEVYSRLAYFLAAQRAQDWQPPKDTGVPRRAPKLAPGISQRNLAHKATSTPVNSNATTVTLQASTTQQAPPQNTGKRARDEEAEDEHGAKRAKSVTLRPKVQSDFSKP